jgi:hypothetical protein
MHLYNGTSEPAALVASQRLSLGSFLDSFFNADLQFSQPAAAPKRRRRRAKKVRTIVAPRRRGTSWLDHAQVSEPDDVPESGPTPEGAGQDGGSSGGGTP